MNFLKFLRQLISINFNKFLLISTISIFLTLITHSVIFSQDDYLDVKGNIKADTLTFKPFTGDTGGQPSTPVEGELFYDYSSAGTFIKQPIYYDGSMWQAFTSQADKFVATHIVAAPDSKDRDRAEPKYRCSGPDCARKINDAINDLPAAGGSVYLLEGTYEITEQIGINKSNVSLIGAGNNTVLRGNGTTESIVICFSNASGVLISQLVVDANNQEGFGIYLGSVSNSKIDKVWVKNASFRAICLEFSNSNTITNCRIGPNKNEGIYLSFSKLNIISGNHLVSNRIGINSIGGDNNTIFNNYIGSNDNYAVILGGENNIVSANMIKSSGEQDAAILVSNPYNIISDNGIYYSSWVWANGITVENNSNLISGNTIRDITGDGISIVGSSSNSVIGNAIYGGTSGIRLKRAEPLKSNYNLIASNFISNTAAGTVEYPNYMIDIYEDRYLPQPPLWERSSDNYIVGNQLVLGTEAYLDKIRDMGCRTSYTDKMNMSITRMPKIGINANYQTLNPNTSLLPGIPSAASYYPLDAITTSRLLNATTPITAGSAPGDILILEGEDSATTPDGYLVGVPCYTDTTQLNSGCQYYEAYKNYFRTLGKNDILELIWNGEKWLEVKYVRNR